MFFGRNLIKLKLDMTGTIYVIVINQYLSTFTWCDKNPRSYNMTIK